MLVPLVAYYLVFYNGDNHSISERRGLTAFWYSTTRSFPLQIWYSFTRSFPLHFEIQHFYKTSTNFSQDWKQLKSSLSFLFRLQHRLCSEWFFKCSFWEALFTKWHLHCLGVNWYFFWGCDLLSQSLAPKLDLQYSGKIQWFPRFIGTISSPEDKKGVWNIPRGFLKP